MIFDVPFLIEYFSSFMTLQPGDLILTGTPDGVVDCQPDDVIVTEIEGIGALENTIAHHPNKRGQSPIPLMPQRSIHSLAGESGSDPIHSLTASA